MQIISSRRMSCTRDAINSARRMSCTNLSFQRSLSLSPCVVHNRRSLFSRHTNKWQAKWQAHVLPLCVTQQSSWFLTDAIEPYRPPWESCSWGVLPLTFPTPGRDFVRHAGLLGITRQIIVRGISCRSRPTTAPTAYFFRRLRLPMTQQSVFSR